MQEIKMKYPIRLLAVAAFAAVLMPEQAHACACGCGVFDVGTSTMMPTDAGGTVWFEYDFMNQQTNWHNGSEASKADNPDKVLRSNFFQVGGQYMFNRTWGIMGEIPFTDRFFKTTDEDTGNLTHAQHSAFGDIHLQGIYSGFSDDMSSGLTFGFKLPTGDFRYSGFDRDTAIGSGSTDWLLGGYHMGALAGQFDWFANGVWDHPFLTQGGYHPGDEVDGAIGSYYSGFDLGDSGKIAPLLQLIGSQRWQDSGSAANAPNSGYQRLLISPGVEYDIDAVKMYGDVEFPIYQHVNGDQIVAPVFFKFIVGYSF
jgi:hypothetical protein